MSETIYKDSCKGATFKAPEGDYRQIVKDYMLKMTNVEWTPEETFDIGWEGTPKFGVNLTCEKEVKFRGVTYANTKCTLDEFELPKRLAFSAEKRCAVGT